MGSHPINLVIRFLLEVAALVSAGMWGWRQSDNWLQFVYAIGLPIFLAAIWGIFAVANDPSRSGKTIIKTPGIIRLFIELAFFAFACWVLFDMGFFNASLALAIITLLHYLFSFNRIKWLLKQ